MWRGNYFSLSNLKIKLVYPLSTYLSSNLLKFIRKSKKIIQQYNFILSLICLQNGIQCFWDERKSVLYLHAITYLDTKRLATLAADLDEDSKCSVKDADAAHWLVATGELAIESCRAMTLIFHLCHIIILSLPTPVFDLGYLQLFEAIDGYR